MHNYTSLFTEFVFYQRNDYYSFFGVQAKVVVTKYQLSGIHDEFVMEANRISRLVIFNRVKTLVNVGRRACDGGASNFALFCVQGSLVPGIFGTGAWDARKKTIDCPFLDPGGKITKSGNSPFAIQHWKDK